MLEFFIGKLRVMVHFSFFAVLWLMLELTQSDWGLWCAGAAILHELGHLTAFAAMGAAPEAISLECGGIRIVPSGKLLPAGREALVLLGGSGINLLAAAVLFLLKAPLAAGFHLFLGLFNLLPLRALDGGQLLTLLAETLWSERAAEWLSWTVSLLTLVPLLYFGWHLFARTGNFTLIFTIVCLLLTALFPRQTRSV